MSRALQSLQPRVQQFSLEKSYSNPGKRGKIRDGQKWADSVGVISEAEAKSFQYESATSRKSGARVPSCAPRGGTPATLGSELFAAVFAGPGLCVAAALMLSSP